ncbi:MAG: hypothetical protein HN742_06770 [Lentisphaerae bacterium]|jgi:hypothetical protein|nr:hypothetical protein [Lentisphaerota bacterium]MBT4823202.1 hypothetical protein [Lentisphaerota bacterium]MBT5605863.1 hypothetical protein [Lentisphaerota bacterium]MBT7055952.1 hypothetical protein [Lentisphaerota bacterium]MBT7841555.1 hypothetical protein [Lentisphaerota bacterium]
MGEKYHWSFNDNVMLRNTIFPQGFSAPESTLPTAAFDASSDWESSYDLVYCGPQDFTEPNKVAYGSLTLGATFSGDRVRLTVNSIRQTGQHFRKEREFLTTAFDCNRDALWSLKDPSSWQLAAETRNVQSAPAAPSRNYTLKGSLKNGKLWKKGKTGRAYVYRQLEMGVPVVASWALLAAVQSMPRDRRFPFSYFEDLERFSAGHSIAFLEEFEAEFGGRKVMIHGYTHKGPGIIPSYYWVDDSGRLLIARFGLSMLVYNAKPLIDSQPAKAW